MYEPKYPPRLSEQILPLPWLCYGITNPSTVVRPNDPESEPLHMHEFCEIFFNVTGEVSFLVNNRLFPVRPGEAVLCRPNELHVCIYDVPCRQEHFCLWLNWEGEEIPFSFLSQRGRLPHFSFDEETVAMLSWLFRRLHELSETDGAGMEKDICLLRILWLFECARNEEKPMTPIPQNMQRILDDIEQHFFEVRHVKDLSERHFVSVATLNRWFRKYLHIPPREYLESKKLSHAAAMLSAGATVTEACMQSGFSDCSHFIVLFKKKFGTTPLSYKRYGASAGRER